MHEIGPWGDFCQFVLLRVLDCGKYVETEMELRLSIVATCDMRWVTSEAASLELANIALC